MSNLLRSNLSCQLLLLIFLACTAQTFADGLLISEVYVNSPGKEQDAGKEWFELYNASDKPIDLSGMDVKNFEGKTKKLAWQVKLPAEKYIINPNEYVVIAQSRDLGIGKCIEIPILILTDPLFSFPNGKTQTLCIEPVGQKETCAQFSDSNTFPDGQSRFAVQLNSMFTEFFGNWMVEECLLIDKIFATPGAPSRICNTNKDFYLDKMHSCYKSSVGHSAPTISNFTVSQSSEQQMSISYQISDDDPEDIVELSIYYTSGSDTVGRIIAHKIQAGSDKEFKTYVWATNEVPDGMYRIFVKAEDSQGNTTLSNQSEVLSIAHIISDPAEPEEEISSIRTSIPNTPTSCQGVGFNLWSLIACYFLRNQKNGITQKRCNGWSTQDNKS